MIVVHTSIPIKPDHREEALEITRELTEKSQQEDGTITYRAMTDITKPDTIRFFEQYKDVEEAQAHSQTDHYELWIEQLADLVDGPVETIQFELDDTPEPIEFDIEAAF